MCCFQYSCYASPAIWRSNSLRLSPSCFTFKRMMSRPGRSRDTVAFATRDRHNVKLSHALANQNQPNMSIIFNYVKRQWRHFRQHVNQFRPRRNGPIPALSAQHLYIDACEVTGGVPAEPLREARAKCLRAHHSPWRQNIATQNQKIITFSGSACMRHVWPGTSHGPCTKLSWRADDV
jgi:hypothetical protein